MFSLILISLVIVALVGLVTKYLTDQADTYYSITWPEFGVVCAVAAVIVIPLVTYAGWHIAVNNMVKYHEFWNGWEQEAVVEVTTCEKDGSCSYTYDCDPYEVTDSSTDANGNTTYSSHTEYHDCPYVTREYAYVVKTTLGDFTIGGVRWAAHPQLWYGVGSDDRDGLPDVPRGAPELWTQARDRIARGDNGPVTKQADYDNFILASQSTILKQYSDSIRKYQKQHLLQKLDHRTWYYYAAKVQFAGFKAADFPNYADWETDTMRLDAALGTDLQGDFHIVFVPASTPADNYTLSLQAYWGSAALGKYDLSKNGIVLVVGTDGKTATWVRAFTGMPMGNNLMLKKLQDAVKGQPLDPKVWLGHPTVTFTNDKPVTQHTHGLIEDVLFGKATRFQRVCMSCKDKTDHGVGYLYLKNELKPGGTAKTVTVIISTLLSALMWIAAWKTGSRPGKRRRYYW